MSFAPMILFTAKCYAKISSTQQLDVFTVILSLLSVAAVLAECNSSSNTHSCIDDWNFYLTKQSHLMTLNAAWWSRVHACLSSDLQVYFVCLKALLRVVSFNDSDFACLVPTFNELLDLGEKWFGNDFSFLLFSVSPEVLTVVYSESKLKRKDFKNQLLIFVLEKCTSSLSHFQDISRFWLLSGTC